MSTAGTQLYFNGINGTTGNYLVPPLATSKAAGFITGNPMDPAGPLAGAALACD